MIGKAQTLEDRIRIVRALPRPARLAALVAGLRVASDAERERLTLELLELALLPEGRVSARARRSADGALVALLRAWPSLPSGVRSSTAEACEGRWAAAADSLLRTDPLALARAAAALALPELARAVGAILSSEDPAAHEAHEEAERALLAMALRVRPDLPAGWVDPSLAGSASAPQRSLPPDDDGLDLLSSELAEAGWRFAQHRCKGVLLAALLVLASPKGLPSGPSGERLARLFSPGEHPGVTAARGVLRWSRAPAARRAAWRLLADRRFARPARDRIARAGGTLDHDAVLAEAHLALRPSRVVALRSIEVKRTRSGGDAEGQSRLAPGGPLPLPEELEHLPSEARRGLPRFIDALTPPGPARRLALSPLLADTDRLVRFNASRVCDPSELSDYCFDVDGAIARSAVLRCSTVGAEGWLSSSVGPGAGQRLRLAGHLRRSPHAGVRELAPDEHDRHTPWNHASPSSRLVARRMLQRHPDAFFEQLAAVVGSGPIEGRCGAVMVARTLGVCSKIERELIEAARLPSGEQAEKLTATAARALGELDSAESLRALHFCLSHAVGRVRANAADAIGRRVLRSLAGSCGTGGVFASGSPAPHAPRPTPHTPHPPQEIGVLLELKSDDHHRVRAGALRSLLAVGAASADGDSGGPSAQIEAMLGDPRWAHRLAGVWLAERAPGLIEPGDAPASAHEQTRRLAKRIVSIAGEDPDERVRRRAMGCARRLLLRLTPVGSEEVHS